MPRRGLVLFLSFLITALFMTPVQPQEAGHSRLQDLRARIARYRQQLLEKQSRAENIVETLDATEGELDAVRQLVRELKNETKRRTREIAAIEGRIQELEAESARLRELIARRMVHLYKHGRTGELKLLIRAQSFSDLTKWVRFQRIIAQNDLRSMSTFAAKERKLSHARSRLELELAAKQALLTEQTVEEARLSERQEERKLLLDQVKKDQQSLLRRIQEYQRASQEILRIISRQEARRAASINVGGYEPHSEMPDMKGKLIWPAMGRIITPFGQQRHPVLKTVTQNLGIDIKAPLDSPVYAVAAGVISKITWHRGRGNIIILNHYEGFRTVYAHLGEIWVTIGDEVGSGQQIATVGETGSLNGPVLHFEVWRHTDVQDPAEWLAKVSF